MPRGAVSTAGRGPRQPRATRRKSGPLAESADLAALFHDGKEAQALRTIGEVARALGVPQHVLRYWETQFPALRPLTRAGGRRYYRQADIALVLRIHRLLHREGYTIRGALAALKQPPAPPPKPRPAPVDAGPLFAPRPEQTLITALDVLRRHLESIRQRLADALD